MEFFQKNTEKQEVRTSEYCFKTAKPASVKEKGEAYIIGDDAAERTKEIYDKANLKVLNITYAVWSDLVSKDENKIKTAELVIPLKAENVMTTEVAVMKESESAKKAAEIMAQEDVSAIIVTVEGKAKGIVTERDILKRIVAEDKNARNTKLKEIMSSPLVTVEPNTDLEEAARLMFEKKMKNLPVVHKNRLMGLLNLQDICLFQPEILKLLRKTMEPPKNIQKVLRYYIT